MQTLPPVALLGAGNMGEALLKGLLDGGLVTSDSIVAAERYPERARYITDRYGIAVHPSVSEACRGAETVVLAVKPQDAGPVIEQATQTAPGALLISICAGVTLAKLAAHLPESAPAVRVMPNTPALVGCAASVFCPNAHVTDEQRSQVEHLLGAVGQAHGVEDEALLDAVTGLSGSGPAYVFTFLEALADGGVRMGLPRPLARALAAQTVLGAARLAQEAGEHTAELKDRVCSPGGTTIEAQHVLETRGFRAAVIEAVAAATRRAREMGD